MRETSAFLNIHSIILVLLLFCSTSFVYAIPQFSDNTEKDTIIEQTEDYQLAVAPVLKGLKHPWGLTWLPLKKIDFHNDSKAVFSETLRLINGLGNNMKVEANKKLDFDLQQIQEHIDKKMKNDPSNISIPILSKARYPYATPDLSAHVLLVTERNGSLWLIDPLGRIHEVQGLTSEYRVFRSAPVLPLSRQARSSAEPSAQFSENSQLNVFQHGQGGWLDIAAHENGYVYLSYSKQHRGKATTALVRFILGYDGKGFFVQELEELFAEEPALFTQLHFGAPLAFDDQGHVFLGLGERGIRDESQNKDSHLGGIIRLHLDGTVPADNPFVKGRGLPELFSYGHRNVQGIFYDKDSALLFAHEHGPQGGDELNIVVSGANYGWPVITYGKEYGSGRKIGEGYSKEGMMQPLKYWDPSPALSGMLRYNGKLFSRWQHNLFIGALKFQSLYRLTLKDGSTGLANEEIILKNKVGRIRSVKQGPDGALYILTDKKRGDVLRLYPVN